MEILVVTYEAYKNTFSNSYHRFLTADFNELNKDKAKKVYYLLFKDSKVRLGLILGEKEGKLFSPFSAPFGSFVFLRESVKIKVIEEAVHTLITWAKSQTIKEINITLPPSIYQDTFISKQVNVFYRSGFKIAENDLNYSYHLKNFNNDYITKLWRNARKNLNIALKNSLSFEQCSSDEQKELAYQIIQKNRKEKGFPLRMSWEQIKETIAIIPADFFLVKTDKKAAIAAAMIFYVSETVVQVVYWGDLPEFTQLKTMNFLSYKVFEYYKNTNIQIVDIGPSTENSIPNYGLCEFKESIGCDIELKLTFSIKV